MGVNAIVVVASSEAELRTRDVAAEARMWLQKAVLASSSHGVRHLATDGAAPLDSMPVLLAADTDLSVIQGEEAHAFVDNPMFDRLRSNLSGSIGQLQALLNTTQLRVSQNEAMHRNETLQACARPGACLAAVNFARRGDKPVPGFTTVVADTLWNTSTGLGFVNTGDALRDARVGFETKLPDDLHRSGVFHSYTSTFRLDVTLTGEMGLPSTLLLTIVSGFDDLGSPSTSEDMGVWGGQSPVPSSGMCSGDSCGGYETKSWMGHASTAVSVAVRPAGKHDAALPMPTPVPCMLGEVGRPNGYWVTRTCRVNVSEAVAQSTSLQIDLVLAPQNGMTGCWSEACGKLAFAWLLNALTLQLPASTLPPRARASLAAADVFSASAVREWAWIGPFDDDHGNGMAITYEIESLMARSWLPPNISQSCVGKHGLQMRWRVYSDSDAATAPHLPLATLLPERGLNTGSVAFAMARVFCALPSGCEKQLQVGMSDRGRMWLLSATGAHAPKEVLDDNLLHGLVSDEHRAAVTVQQGWSVFVVKTVSTFAADTIAVNGSRAEGWGEVNPIPGVLGTLNGTNEWGVALSIR